MQHPFRPGDIGKIIVIHSQWNSELPPTRQTSGRVMFWETRFDRFLDQVTEFVEVQFEGRPVPQRFQVDLIDHIEREPGSAPRIPKAKA